MGGAGRGRKAETVTGKQGKSFVVMKQCCVLTMAIGICLCEKMTQKDTFLCYPEAEVPMKPFKAKMP